MIKMEQDPKLNIIVFSWNANNLRICETMNQLKANEARKGLLNIFSKPCLAPDFFENMRDIIKNKKANIVVVSTQSEDNSNSYFHSDLLYSQMLELKYVLLKRYKLENVGQLDSGLPYDTPVTGSISHAALRMSIFILESDVPYLTLDEPMLSKSYGNYGQVTHTFSQVGRKFGAIGAYVNHSVYGRFLFVALDLPLDMTAARITNPAEYEFFRATVVTGNNLFLLQVIDKFVNKVDVKTRPQHIFLLGDMNYDIVIPNKTNLEIVTDLTSGSLLANIERFMLSDELTQNKNKLPARGFSEGVSNKGPMFAPTWRLRKNRSPDECDGFGDGKSMSKECFNYEKDNLSAVGWHNRILYRDIQDSINGIFCEAYNRLDVGNTVMTDNAAVFGFFNVRAINRGEGILLKEK
jgi:hypothetical protein